MNGLRKITKVEITYVDGTVESYSGEGSLRTTNTYTETDSGKDLVSYLSLSLLEKP